MNISPPLIPSSLSKLAAEAVAKATAPAPSVVVAPRRVPANIWAALIVGGVILFSLYRQWQDANGNPVQGPPQPGAAGNNRRSTRNPAYAGAEVLPHQNGGVEGVGPGGWLLRYQGSATGSRWDYNQSGAYVPVQTVTRTWNTTRANHGSAAPVGYSNGQGKYDAITIGAALWDGTPASVAFAQFPGASTPGAWSLDSYSNNQSLEAGGPVRAAGPGRLDRPVADPSPALIGAPGLAPAPPRSLAPPIGAAIPRDAPGALAVPGSTVGAAGVPESAIPRAPSISSTGTAVGQVAGADARDVAIAAGAGAGTLTLPGSVAVPQSPAVPLTPAEALVLAGVVLLPQAVRDTITAVATEVGRLESKAEFSIQGPGAQQGGDDGTIWDRLDEILARIMEGNRGLPEETWVIEDGCSYPDGVERPKIEVSVSASEDAVDGIQTRLLKLAELLQAHKRLKGPTCGRAGGRPQGEGVTVHFEQI